MNAMIPTNVEKWQALASSFITQTSFPFAWKKLARLFKQQLKHYLYYTDKFFSVLLIICYSCQKNLRIETGHSCSLVIVNFEDFGEIQIDSFSFDGYWCNDGALYFPIVT
jgi:hypothetical protein